MTDNKVVNLEEIRKKNLAKIESGKDILNEMKKDCYISAFGFFLKEGDKNAKFLATSKLNPLECAGILLNMAVKLANMNNFDETDKI